MSAEQLRAATDAAQTDWATKVSRLTARWAADVAQLEHREDAHAALYRLLARETRAAAAIGTAAVAGIVDAAGVTPNSEAAPVDVGPPRYLARTLSRDWVAADSAPDPRAAREAAARRIIDLSLTDAWRTGMTAGMDADDAVIGSRRVSRPGCCGACLALADGQVRPLGSPFPRHPFCRCIDEPVVRHVNEHDPGRPSPQQRWDAMSRDEQNAMFHGHGGEAKADLLRDGDATLDDLLTVHERDAGVQAPLVTETPLAALVSRAIEGYDRSDGPRRGLPTQRAQAPPGDAPARPPGIPAVGELADLNRAIHDDAGQPERFALDQRAPVLDALDRAAAAHGDTPAELVAAAAELAHGIASAQSFRDGNRRTAYWATRAFLNANGLGYLMSEDDHMVARLLNRLVEDQGRARPTRVTADSLRALFERRLKNRTPPST